MSTVYYCWLCERPLSDGTVSNGTVSNGTMSDTHYESEREIFFCSPRHWSEYQSLRGL